MKRHGSMNRRYRLVWSEVLNAWIAVAEHTRGHGKADSGRKLIQALLSALLLPGLALAAPEGGQVVSGTGQISRSGATTTIQQSSARLSLNWNSFNIAPSETVNFLQPSAAAIAVNRILDTQGTQILGRIQANGQVYLINPNGILFGQGAQVNVGGLVASTLDVSDAALSGSTRYFSGNGSGRIINQGTITAAPGGYAALLGQHVSNEGVITAQQGTVALGAGSAATLTFSGNHLVQMQIDQSVLNSLAHNGGLIQADGGLVMMTAGARNALLASVVNNTGVIQAHTVENRNGTIVLLGGMQAGSTQVGGTLDASAPQGGDGGFIETSAAHVSIASEARITTAAAAGVSGTWLIDPLDFTIAASGGDITGTALSGLLGSNSVIVSTTAGANTATNLYSTTTGPGDIHVNDAVSWAANTLTLSADRNININANLNGSGSASLALHYGQGAVAAGNTSDYTFARNFQANLPAGPNYSTKQGSDGVVTHYTVINSLGAQGSISAADLQGMTGNLAGHYALGSNIDAAITSTWNSGAGFTPIALGTQFTGRFDGLGHTISDLTINNAALHVGLFSTTGPTADLRNVGLVGGSLTGSSSLGWLVGSNTGVVSHSYATGSVSGTSSIGGLVGDNIGGTIRDSHATGNLSGSSNAGGLVGNNATGTVSRSYATGTVDGTSSVGGLVGGNTTGAVSQSYATGNVNGSTGAGGLIGRNDSGLVSDSYATGNVVGTTSVGGLVGINTSGSISNTYARGSVLGFGSVGGLLGSGAGTISNSYWDTTSSGTLVSAGGTGLTTAQMLQQASFNSWDFANTWIIYNGITTPLLRTFMTALTVAANNASRTYDAQAFTGGNGVSYSTTPDANLLGTVSYSGSSQGATNVGTSVITPGGLYSNQQGYAISYADGTLNTTAYAVSLSGSRGYDGTTTVQSGALALGPLVGSQTLILSGSGTVANKNVGSAKPLTVTGLTLGDGTGLASNYTFSGGTQTANITQAALTLSTSNVSKIYDGGLSAAGTAIVTSGTLYSAAGDTLSGG
ncbi:MAG: filamentous hemagglutinin N-terminal domain-containing protein, partial [Hylemonella sp.]|nr:filamentous hemagglutinin N-terminal domain-containing protein [Hylemonella sp.]